MEKSWWDKREENENAWKVSAEDIIKSNYKCLDIKNPNKQEEKLESPEFYLNEYRKNYEKITEIKERLEQEIEILLKGE